MVESVGLVKSSGEALRTLGLKPGATEEEIKSAFRKLSIAHHPDRGGSKDMQKLLNSAFDYLRDNGFGQTSGSSFRPDSAPSWRPSAPSPRRSSEMPPWQTDTRSSYNEVGKDFRNLNFCKKAIYEKAMESMVTGGGKLDNWTIQAFDGTFFRGMFSVYCNKETLGFAGMAMEQWNSKGSNSYPTVAVFASQDFNDWQLVRLNGQDVALEDMHVEGHPNDQSFLHYLRNWVREAA
jgi:curved DNA-binding protein CbpA